MGLFNWLFGDDDDNDKWIEPKIQIVKTSSQSKILQERRKAADEVSLTCPECGYTQQDKSHYPMTFGIINDAGISISHQTCKKCGCEWRVKCDLNRI